MKDPSLQAEIRRARGKFIAMATSYSLGVFNDNFFKQAAMLLAIDAGRKSYQGWMALLFTLPYLLVAAPAGWLADRFAKRHVVIAAKGLEVAAMACGAAGLLTGSWPLIFAMVFTMGLQSCVFGPSLNGSIPELYPASYVTTANGVLKVFVTAAILLGVAAAGFIKPARGEVLAFPAGLFYLAATVLGVAAAGFAASFRVPYRPPVMHDGRRFPWTGPWQTIRILDECFHDKMLSLAILADVFIWSMGLLELLVINVLGKNQLGVGDAGTSCMLVAQLGGVAAGGLLAGRLARGERWHRVLAPAAAGMAVGMAGVWGAACLPAGDLRFAAVLASLAFGGACGGLFMIPCESFIQVRPAGDRRGATIASASFLVFAGIMTAGLIANVLNEYVLPSGSFGILAAVSLAAGLVLRIVLKGEQARR
jgi:acyl-[acyl-carrier-protein]-phospholipid O-acyltransferase/long-chain-fatty-acid--[acyl-carrier-protein] ligase